SLEYAHDIEDRVDGRSLLAEGFRSHRGRLLTMFNVENLDDLDGIEREAVRRLVKRRVIREQGPGGENRAQDIDAFNAAVLRFQDAVDREEPTEVVSPSPQRPLFASGRLTKRQSWTSIPRNLSNNRCHDAGVKPLRVRATYINCLPS